MNQILVLTFLISVLCGNSLQHSRGAPISRCVTLTPSHQGTLPQETPAPFKIFPRENSVGNGRTLSVEIRATEEGRTFRGYMLQARTTENVVVGQFKPVEGRESNFLDCTGLATTMTNANNNEDSSVVFEWTAPLQFTGIVKFQ